MIRPLALAVQSFWISNMTDWMGPRSSWLI